MRAVREVIIYDHDSLLPIDIELHGIASGFVDFFSEEDAFDSVGVFSQRGNRRQKVTVTTVALSDIIRRDRVIDGVLLVFVDFSRPFPRERLP